MYYVYVVKNPKNIFYKGHTNNVERRIREHNSVGSKFSKYTKNQGPWILVYKEKHYARSKAMLREKYFKTGKGREELMDLLDGGSPPRRTKD